MRKEREEYLKITERLHGDPEGQKKAAAYLDKEQATYHGARIPISFTPAFYTEADLNFLKDVCTTTHTILTKVIRHYLENPEYRNLFGFSPELEQLILLPCGYEDLLPIARFDLFLDEGTNDFRFCEFNADGTAAMSRTTLGCEAVKLSKSFQTFAEGRQISDFELFDSWVDTMMRIYAGDKNAVSHPNVLITDFADEATMTDIRRFLAAFEKKGLKARFVDTGKLVFDGKHLIDPSDGMIFHAVYRRIVTHDVLTHMDACKAMIDAVKAQAVCLIGHFRTSIIHSKMVNVALLNEQTKAILTEKEWEFVKSHVLPTYRLRHDNPAISLKEIKENRLRWILKPEDDQDAHGVYAGIDMTDEDWGKAVEETADHGYIVMEYFRPQRVKIFPLHPVTTDERVPVPEDYSSMTGLYCYNGKFAGFFSRMGKSGVIAETKDGVSVPSFKLKTVTS